MLLLHLATLLMMKLMTTTLINRQNTHKKRLSINGREGHNTKALEITADVHKDEDFVSGGGQAFRRWSRSLATADQDADQESEGIDAPCTADSSIIDADSWEEWEEFDFLSTDDDSADEWLP